MKLYHVPNSRHTCLLFRAALYWNKFSILQGTCNKLMNKIEGRRAWEGCNDGKERVFLWRWFWPESARGPNDCKGTKPIRGTGRRIARKWIMGSLPNLHELSKEKLESPAYRPAPIGGLGPIRLPAQPPPLAHTHRRARSSGHHHALWDNDAMLEVWQ